MAKIARDRNSHDFQRHLGKYIAISQLDQQVSFETLPFH